MKTFTEWLKIREYGTSAGLPYGAQATQPTSVQTQPQVNPARTAQPQTSLVGVPPHIVQALQRTGPAMQNIMNQANKSIQMGTHRDLSSALQAALQQQPQQVPMVQQPGVV
jgi:hypothetical protein